MSVDYFNLQRCSMTRKKENEQVTTFSNSSVFSVATGLTIFFLFIIVGIIKSSNIPALKDRRGESDDSD